MKIAVVIARFNETIVFKMLEHAGRAFSEAGLTENDMDFIYVPGSFEIPATIQKAIDTKKYDGVLALGCVIKGETHHYEYVCEGLVYGMQKVAIENRFPVVFGVLTVPEERLAVERISQGYDYGKALLSLIEVHKNLSS